MPRKRNPLMSASAGSGSQTKKLPMRQIVESAYDFLTRAAEEIVSHPKYSIINFATAIELMLKARLMKEHWSLVVDKTSEADHQDFIDGKLKTVTPREAIRRLRNVANESIPEDAKAAFESIANHRNRVMHFYHEATSAKASPEKVAEIVKEQCLGWYHLERLLNQWGKPFLSSKKDVQRIDRLMRDNRQYLGTVYETELPKIGIDKRAGVKFTACGGCGFSAAAVSDLSDAISDHDCRVCRLSQRFIAIKCPNVDCAATIHMESDYGSERKCTSCGHELTVQEIDHALDTEDVRHDDPPTAKNCAYCVGYHTVVKHHKHFVCTECLTVSEAIYGCGWCNELQMGSDNLEHSYYRGCEFCDGKAGWEGDRD